MNRLPIREVAISLMLLLTSAIWGAAMDAGSRKFTKIYRIPIQGEVEPSMAAFLKRALQKIDDRPGSLVIVEMDTFGGRVDSALEMVDTLLNVKNAWTVAYVNNKAISAGALISLACHELVMERHTTIGDCAPITISSEGAQMLGEKFQSPLRAKFRTLAKRNGYPETLAEAMVSEDIEVFQLQKDGEIVYMDSREYEALSDDEKAQLTAKKTAVAKGELLTMDDHEARQYGFSSMSVDNLDDMLNRMEIMDLPLTRIDKTWSEVMVGFIGSIAPILMLIGLGGLYVEIKSPGFGVPGLVGILCLALVFFNQYLVGLADYTELFILLTGFILLGFELFVIPGFGICGIAGLVCIAAGLVLALQDFVIPDPALPWESALMIDNLIKVLSSILGAFFLALLTLRFILPKVSKVVHGPYLDSHLGQARADSPDAKTLAPGLIGKSLTLLRPSGKMKLDGRTYDVVTQGEYIEKGADIKIVTIKGNRIIVSKGVPHEQ